VASPNLNSLQVTHRVLWLAKNPVDFGSGHASTDPAVTWERRYAKKLETQTSQHDATHDKDDASPFHLTTTLTDRRRPTGADSESSVRETRPVENKVRGGGSCGANGSAMEMSWRKLMVALYTDPIVSTSKHSKENHQQTQDAHAVIVLPAPVNFGFARSAFGASRSKETGFSGTRHGNAINLSSGMTRPNNLCNRKDFLANG
jgi:hypothetical protein